MFSKCNNNWCKPIDHTLQLQMLAVTLAVITLVHQHWKDILDNFNDSAYAVMLNFRCQLDKVMVLIYLVKHQSRHYVWLIFKSVGFE